MGRSEVNFGKDPLAIEEAEDLHVLLQRLGIDAACFYGMSAGARSNLILAQRYPEAVAALVIAPLTGGHTAAGQLPEVYYLKYLADDALTSMDAVAQTPLWSAYIERNSADRAKTLLSQDVADFLAVMQRSGTHLQAYVHQTALGMTDEELAALNIPATLILHHGDETDALHPIPHSRAATTLIANSKFVIAETHQAVVET